MLKNKKIFGVPLIVITIPLILLCLFIFVFIFLQSPLLINALAQALGLNMSIGNISVSPALSTEVRELRFEEAGRGGMSVLISHASIQLGINKSLQPEVRKAAIHEPRVLINLGAKDKKLDLSFLGKLPPVQFLEITNGEVHISTGRAGETIRLWDINFTLKDFSSKKGGSVRFKCKANIKSAKNGTDNGEGLCEGNFHFTKIAPEPAGSGVIKFTLNNGDFQALKIQSLFLHISLQINAGELIISPKSPSAASFTYKSDERVINLKDLQFMPHAHYGIKTGSINASVKSGKIGGIGAFEADIHSVLRQDYPWKASLRVSAVNIEKASEIFKSFLPTPYNNWSFQGTGAIEISITGDFKDKRFSGSGRLMLEFKDGGFSSPGGDMGGQGVGGKLIMDIEMPSHAERGNFDISSEVSLGEFLWGRYYRDFAGEKAFFLSKGALSREILNQLDFSGSLNLGKGGSYSYSATITPQNWTFNINSKDINLQAFYSFFFRDYIKQDFPSLSKLDLQGEAGFEVFLEGKDEEFVGQGNLIINKGKFSVGDSLYGVINLNLPFDFFHPENQPPAVSSVVPRIGALQIESIETPYAVVKDTSIPLVFSGNTIAMLRDSFRPFSGLPVTLTHFRGERLLSRDRSFNFGVTIKEMEIGSLIEKVSGLNIPGRLTADLPEITIQNGVLSSRGKADVSIFGGKIDIDNLWVGKIFSPSRVVGCDMAFEGINLQELTGYVKLGRMSGIINGSFKGLEVEYGQPARFILDIESVRKEGVSQSVSVDAIENISIVGSGSAGVGIILKSGLNRFFKEYPYSRMGVRSTLENDVFTIRGKIFEGGREYLIRKAFLRGIDVINQNPENTMSFRDMKERINRVFEKARQ